MRSSLETGPASRPPASVEVAVEGEVASIAREWEELAERVQAPPFLRAGWIDAWWRAFGCGQLELTTARRNGRLVGILPLARRHRVLRSTANWHSPLFRPLSEDEPAGLALIEALFAGRRSRRVDFSPLDGEVSAADDCRAAAEAAGYRVLVRTVSRAPYVRVAGDWEQYRRRLSRNRRRAINRRERALQTAGELSVEVVHGGGRLDLNLAEAFGIEATGWKAKNGTAIMSRSETRQFYIDIAHWAAERGWLRLTFLRLDGRPLAFEYALEHEGASYVLKAGFDVAFRRHAPGVLLLERALARAFADRLSSYEFLGTDDPYKREWTDNVRERVRVQAFRQSPAGLLDWLAFAYGRRWAKALLRR